jgi:two-component system cell cycle sensor histidine kinase/response regulator CckA
VRPTALIAMSMKTEIRSTTPLRFDSVEPGLAAPSVFWTTDRRLRITSAHGSGLNALGLTAQSLVGSLLHEHLDGEHAGDPILVAHNRVLAGESLCFQANLASHPVEIIIAPQRIENGEVAGTIGMARLIVGAPPAIKQEIEESDRFRALMAKSPDVLVLTDANAKILFASQPIERVLGYPPSEYVGRVGFSFFHPEHESAARELLLDVLSESGKSRTEKFLVRAKDNNWKQVELTCTNLLDDPDIGAVVVNFRDITERNRIEAERQVMVEIIHALNVTSNLDELLAQMHQALKKVVSAENCFVALYDKESSMVRFPFVVDRYDKAPPPHKVGRTCSAYVLRTGKPLLANKRTFLDLAERGEIDIVGTPSAAWLGVPLRTASATLGVLVVQNYDDENAYSQRDVDLLVSVGAQIAMAIQRKRAEQELRKREEENTIIFNSVPGMILFKDKECRIVRANRATAEFFGLPAVEVQGPNVSDLLPNLAGDSEGEDREVMVTGQPKMGTIAMWRAASGEEKVIRTHRIPYRDHEGQIAGVIVLGTDITEQRKSRELLEKAQYQNELILQCAGEGICGVDRKGRCTMVNPAAAELTGWGRDELLGQEMHNVWHHSRLDGTPYPAEDCPVSAVFRDGTSRRVSDEIFWRKDGSFFPVEYVATPMLEGDEIVGAVVTFRDVTREHHARRVLQESESRYRLLVENASYAIFRTSSDGRFLDANHALATMLGYPSKDELLSVNIRESIYVTPEQRDPLVEETITHGRVEGREVEWKRKDGTILTVRLSARMVRDAGGYYFEGIAENISERRVLETQLRQAQKMEAVGRLAGGVAHDFNNLLMVIKGHSELLLDRTAPEHPDFRKVDQIKKAADRAASLTRQLLAFSRMQVMQPRVMDLNATVIEMGKMLPRLIGEDIELKILTKSDLGRVKADPGQIEQVILNLSVNARDAMPDGGKLVIETANAELDEGYARVHPPLVPGSFVMLAVSDTGAGMDAATQAHIFEPFFTTKEKGKGTGLGLATVYGVVKQSGGYIWAYSEPGRGTSFKIFLPRVSETPEIDYEKRPREEPPRGEGTILLAEDEKEVREVAREFLELSGYTVLEAKDGAEAVELAAKHSGAIDLLLTDMVMPGMSGRELSARLTAMRAGLRVIYMSGYTEYAALRHGDTEPNRVMLQKPFTRAMLIHTVRKVLGEQSE